MKLRITTISFLLAVAPALAHGADQAATDAAARAAMLQALARGATITANNEQYQVLPGVRAVGRADREDPQQAATQAGGGKLIETKGSYAVFTAAQGPAVLAVVNGRTTYPAAVNTRTGGIGVLPGTVRVLLKNPSSAAAVASAHGLQIEREFPHLQAAFYRVAPGQDVVAAAAALAADPRVASAAPDVQEHVPVPR